jgi:hypothetical protein
MVPPKLIFWLGCIKQNFEDVGLPEYPGDIHEEAVAKNAEAD